MRIVICDDDEQILAILERYLNEYFHKAHLKGYEIASYINGEALLSREERVDIAILDVEMPGRSGIYIGNALKKKNRYAKIIILTSFSDYLDEAMKFQVFRYLSKPIDKKRLFRNLGEAIRQNTVDTEPVMIETHDGVITKYADGIVLVEVTGRRVMIHTESEVISSIRPIKYWDKLLELGSFYKTHRSFIVNMRYVSSFSRDLVFLTVSSERRYTAYLTKRNYQSFKNSYMLYLEGSK